MSILIRCSKCRNYYSLKHKSCTKCGTTDRSKQYYVHTKWPDGKRTMTYAGNLLANAETMDKSARNDARNSKIPIYAKQSKLTFDEYVNKYFLPHFESKNKSTKEPMYIINHFKDCFEGKELAQITSLDVEQAVNAGTAGKGTSSLNNYITRIRRMFNYAIEVELIDRNPVKIKKSRKDISRKRFLTDKEQKAILAACKAQKTKYLWEMAYISLYTGLRLGEVQAIKREDIRDGCIYVSADIAKSKQGRQVPLTKELQEFFKKTASFDYNHNIKKSWTTARKQAGLEDEIVFHDLRRTFGSMLVQRGVAIYTVSKLLGHANVKVTIDSYAHLASDNLKKAVEALEPISEKALNAQPQEQSPHNPADE